MKKKAICECGVEVIFEMDKPPKSHKCFRCGKRIKIEEEENEEDKES